MSDSPIKLTVPELGARRLAVEQRYEEAKQDLEYKGGSLPQTERATPALLARLEGELQEAEFVMNQHTRMGVDFPMRLERAPAFYTRWIERIQELLRAKSAAGGRHRRTSRPEVLTQQGEDTAEVGNPADDPLGPMPGPSHTGVQASGGEIPLLETQREAQGSQDPELPRSGLTLPEAQGYQSEAEKLRMEALFRSFLAREHPDLLRSGERGNPLSQRSLSSQSATRSGPTDTSVHPQALPLGGNSAREVGSGALQGQSNSGLSPWQSFPPGSNQGGGITEGTVAGSYYQPRG